MRRSNLVMELGAIVNNDIILPREFRKIVSESPSAYLEKTSEPMNLDNRKIDFVLPNSIDMNDM